jgi:hypothetical protein
MSHGGLSRATAARAVDCVVADVRVRLGGPDVPFSNVCVAGPIGLISVGGHVEGL